AVSRDERVGPKPKSSPGDPHFQHPVFDCVVDYRPRGGEVSRSAFERRQEAGVEGGMALSPPREIALRELLRERPPFVEPPRAEQDVEAERGRGFGDADTQVRVFKSKRLLEELVVDSASQRKIREHAEYVRLRNPRGFACSSGRGERELGHLCRLLPAPE